MRSCVAFLIVFITYGVLIAVGTVHLSNGERADVLLPWRAGVAAEWATHVRVDHQLCEFDNIFIGDSMVRTGGSCESEQESTDDVRKNN